MTDQGRSGRRTNGRSGGRPGDGASRRPISRSGDPRDAVGEYVLDRDGNPLVDRYGRPVRRRSKTRPAPRQVPPPPQSAEPTKGPRPSAPPAGSSPAAAQSSHQASPRPSRTPRSRPRREEELVLSSESRSNPPPGPRRRGTRRQGRRRRGPGCLGCVGWLIALLLVLAVVFVLWSDSRLTRIESTPEQPIADTAGTNWLLVGSDSRQGLSEQEALELGTGGDMGAGRTDTIMLLHLPTTGDAQLISIPRDSLVNIPGYGENKINAAFTFGGPQLLSATVEQSTGLSVDHYAEIGMGGLANLVDAVGGVELCVDEPIQDPLANLDVQAGCQEMDGATALGYVRTRATAQGDLDRVERQREFFTALLSEIASPATLFNPVRMVSLAYHGTDTFVVGENDHVWHLARVALAMGSGVETVTVPFTGFLDTSVGNVVLWDEYAAEELFASMR